MMLDGYRASWTESSWTECTLQINIPTSRKKYTQNGVEFYEKRICLCFAFPGICGCVWHKTCSEVNVNILIWPVAKIANFHTVFITNLQGLL